MINKLFHNRVFAVCICAGFAIALLLAKSFDTRNLENFTNADLLVEDDADEIRAVPEVPTFRAVPQELPSVYTQQNETQIGQSEIEVGNRQEILPEVGPSGGSGYPLEEFDSESQGTNENQGAEWLSESVPAIEPLDFPTTSNQFGGGDFQPKRVSPDAMEEVLENDQDAARHRMSENGVDASAAEVDGESSSVHLPADRDETSNAGQKPPAFLPSASSPPKAVSAGSVEPNPFAPTATSPEPTTALPKSPTPKKPNPKSPFQGSDSLNPTNFRLAEQPKEGNAFHPHHPELDSRTWQVPTNEGDFHPGPIYDGLPYDPYGQMDVYEGKTLNATQRPLLELGRPWYQLGQLSEGYDFFGKYNPITPQLIVFGDMRTAYASNNKVNGSDSQVAFEWNMNWDLRLTSTERFAWFLAPTNKGESNTRFELDNDQYVDEWNADFLFGYFEGDLGAMVGGAIGQTLPFDLPFAVGVMPLLFQNGVWLEDQFLGIAATLPAKHNTRLGISNMDVTFFAGYDEIISPAFEFEDDVAKLYGIASFIEANNGYWEIDYAYLEDRDSVRDRSYHNIGIGYSRRYGRWISNSTRIIVNAGQSTEGGPSTADGVLLLSENSLITGAPSSIVPYFNFFAGFDRPQKAAGIDPLRNTGILFESDGMTGYPTLDPSAQNTFGGAVGVNIMPNDFSQQLVLETAFLGVMDEAANRNAAGEQYGVGARYQLPLNNSVILRADAMYGLLRNSEDINGVRVELRRKF